MEKIVLKYMRDAGKKPEEFPYMNMSAKGKGK